MLLPINFCTLASANVYFYNGIDTMLHSLAHYGTKKG